MSLRTLDLFHGAGGCSIGAQEAGAEIIAGIDFWPVASRAYSMNFPNALTISKDIRDVSPRSLKRTIGSIDLIVASPECTNHSCAKGAANRCEESRKTAFQITRFAREFRPKCIVIENVVQMGTWKGYRQLLEELWEMGYFVREDKLNAQDFGVPQSRRRLFLICTMTGRAEFITPKNRPLMNAATVIDKNGNYPFTPLRTPKRAKATLERAERAITEMGNKESFIIVYYGTDGSGGWQSLDRPLRTVTTLDRFAFVKPTKAGHMMRMLQPEELKLAMGFPESYRLEVGTRRDKVKLMGNAVCPPVIDGIIRSLII